MLPGATRLSLQPLGVPLLGGPGDLDLKGVPTRVPLKGSFRVSRRVL